MTLLSSKVQNLFRKYPDEFMQEYRGCSDLDCIPGCSLSNAHCERIAIAFATWQAEHPSAPSTHLLKLADKCESAKDGSFALDKAILAALGFTWRGMDYWSRDDKIWTGPVHFTTSIDAALTLVPTWGVLRFERTGKTFGCFLGRLDTNAATPALALCVAALRLRDAVSAQKDSGK